MASPAARFVARVSSIAPSPHAPVGVRFVASTALLLSALILTSACAVEREGGIVQKSEASRFPLPASSLRYVDGSSQRVEQLIGDIDSETKRPTYNQTLSRYTIRGTDLGNSFEHNGKTYFLFGDTLGRSEGDVIGVSPSTDPDRPLALDFLTSADGQYLRVEPNGTPMGPFDVPVSGISLNGVMYVVVKTNYTPGNFSSFTAVLTRYDESRRSFQVVRELSHLPGGRFITTSLRPAPASLRGLPDKGPYVLIFGTGEYRRSDAYLAVVPVAGFESGEGTRYYAGTTPEGPRWSDLEAEATPIIDHPTIGDFSASYVPDLSLWVSLYDSRQPRGIVLRYAREPWGPWSDPQVVYDPRREAGYGVFIHTAFFDGDDGLAGPVIGERDVFRTSGGIYAPYIIDRLTRVSGDRLTIQYVMSTWNPYVVVRMRSTLEIER